MDLDCWESVPVKQVSSVGQGIAALIGEEWLHLLVTGTGQYSEVQGVFFRAILVVSVVGFYLGETLVNDGSQRRGTVCASPSHAALHQEVWLSDADDTTQKQRTIRNCEASEYRVLVQQLLCPYKNIKEMNGLWQIRKKKYSGV